MNCAGCHFNGGGGMGPPLMDNIWIYGDSIENIGASIREGRPNGMPGLPRLFARRTNLAARSLRGSLSHPAPNDTAAQDEKK